MLRPLVIASALLLIVLASGCRGGATKEGFREDVLAARNETDAGLAQVVQATSIPDLLERLRIAAEDVRRAATDVREAGAPDDLKDERSALADSLLALSDEIIKTVETLEIFPDQAASASAFNFEQWNAVQAQLAKLRGLGVAVPPLERHKAAPEPEPEPH